MAEQSHMATMRSQRGMPLILLLAIAVVVACAIPLLVAADSAVCSASDEECLNDAIVEDCTDDHPEDCKAWSEIGECHANPGYMLKSCRLSCNACEAFHENNDFGKPQLIPTDFATSVKQVISKSVEYMQIVNADPKYNPVRSDCRNNDERCSEWALGTGCDDNPKYMKRECSPACHSCDYVLEMSKKCALDADGKDAIDAGGMDTLFERMVRLADDNNWKPTVLSRPTKTAEINGDGTYTSILSCEEDITNPCKVNAGPWVITLENFITPEEIEVLLKWGATKGYERSQAGDEIVESRTSSHAWCEDDCYNDPLVRSLRARIVHVTGIPEENYESLQLLKYDPGQYYKPHSDFIDNHAVQSHGPRLLTFFMYFNSPEKGGGTRFPWLNHELNGLTVEPHQGRVLIWPSVMDRDLYKEDARTTHEALPVEKGEKWAANAWIHTRDFQGPSHAGCPS